MNSAAAAAKHRNRSCDRSFTGLGNGSGVPWGCPTILRPVSGNMTYIVRLWDKMKALANSGAEPPGRAIAHILTAM